MKCIIHNDCDCMSKSRLDPLGNVVTLYTCKECLRIALANFREYVRLLESNMLQLELFEDVSQEGRASEEGSEPASSLDDFYGRGDNG